MEISLYSDYAFRVLIYLALNGSKLVQIRTISHTYHVSENHLIKVVQHLVKLGYVASVRGRNGGIRLAKSPSQIVVGEVFRKTEPNLKLANCFDAEHNACSIMDSCKLRAVLGRALESFLAILDQKTLADLVSQREQISSTIRIKGAGERKITL